MRPNQLGHALWPGQSRGISLLWSESALLQTTGQLANLWNGYPVNAVCPWSVSTTGYCGRGGHEVVPTATAFALAQRPARQWKTGCKRKEIKLPDGWESQRIMAVLPSEVSPTCGRDCTAWRLMAKRDHSIYFTLKSQLFLWLSRWACQAQPLWKGCEDLWKGWERPEISLMSKWELEPTWSGNSVLGVIISPLYIFKFYWDEIHLI